MAANILTSTRIALAVALFAVLAAGTDGTWLAFGLFAAAALTDVLDGPLARRLGQASAFGAMLDLVADRLLTLGVFGGLVAGGALSGWGAAPAIVLIARDLVVASLNEGAGSRLGSAASLPERIKIACQFVGAAVLMAPDLAGLGAHRAGLVLIWAAAALSLITIGRYWVQAMADLRRP